MSSFPANVCLCPFFWAWTEVSSHPGWGIQPPQLMQVLCSLCLELVASRIELLNPGSGFQSQELSALASVNCIVFIPACCLRQFTFFRYASSSQMTGCFSLPPQQPSHCFYFSAKWRTLFAIFGSGVPLGSPLSPRFSGLTYPITL